MAKYLDYEGLKHLWSKIDSTYLKITDVDNTFLEVVSALPGSGLTGAADASTIGKHLYLVKIENATGVQKYEEYVYTGKVPVVTDKNADNYSTNQYNSNNWELLGDFDLSVDLKDYVKKVDALGITSPDGQITGTNVKYTFYTADTDNDTTAFSVTIPEAKTSTAGVMTASDKTKLDGIAEKANNYTLPIATVDRLGGVKAPPTTTASGISINSATGVIDGSGYVTLLRNTSGQKLTSATSDPYLIQQAVNGTKDFLSKIQIAGSGLVTVSGNGDTITIKGSNPTLSGSNGITINNLNVIAPTVKTFLTESATGTTAANSIGGATSTAKLYLNTVQIPVSANGTEGTAVLKSSINIDFSNCMTYTGSGKAITYYLNTITNDEIDDIINGKVTA